MSFIQRIVGYIANELLVNRLANRRACTPALSALACASSAARRRGELDVEHSRRRRSCVRRSPTFQRFAITVDQKMREAHSTGTRPTHAPPHAHAPLCSAAVCGHGHSSDRSSSAALPPRGSGSRSSGAVAARARVNVPRRVRVGAAAGRRAIPCILAGDLGRRRDEGGGARGMCRPLGGRDVPVSDECTCPRARSPSYCCRTQARRRRTRSWRRDEYSRRRSRRS